MDKQKKKAAGDAAAGAGAPAKTRKIVTVFAVIASVVAALGVFLMVWYLGDRYPDFERRFRQEAEIPALDEGFIPQGLGNSADGDVMFISGYMNDGSPSRIYVLEDGAVTGYVTVTLDDEWKPENMKVVAFIGRPITDDSQLDDVWVNNANMLELGTSTGIAGVTTEGEAAKEVARYSIDGAKVSAPVKGVNVVKMSDGSIKKVIVK